MSYDISIRLHARTSLADSRGQLELGDRERLEFLRRLDEAEDVEVTEWEAQFIAGFLEGPRPMSPKQRECVDEMRKSYEHRLGKTTGPLTTGPQTRQIPEAEPGKCGYFVRGAGHQVRCGLPAMKKTEQGLELCEAHYAARVEYLARLRQMKARRRF